MISQIIEGVVQGVTEFLPISSSGHIVFLEKITEFSSDNLAQIQVALHLGTLLAILIFYYKDLKEILMNIKCNWKFIFYIFLGTLPLVAVYFFCYDYFKNMHNNINHSFDIMSYCIIITGFLLLSTRFIEPRDAKLNYKLILIIGCMQCLAILPGISRSGVTICSALLLGLPSKQATKISFFLAIPAILGVSVLEIKGFFSSGSAIDFPFTGFFTSLIVGYVSLRLLISISSSGKIWYFSIYCFIMGAISFLFF
ncbi:MAG: hypothetical protein CMG00_06660 [Candidatus Marinimicrobia bacterium]|nr:hypothetical protein [Candidatus Neomarinimicrobiota bacterium]|tara:strand:+ start:803 stop:1564 length:762 start_codon:yes stop_codon:yes gene_type:complete